MPDSTPKSEINRSESWVTTLSVVGSILTAITATSPAGSHTMTILSVISALFTVVVYSMMRTPLATDHPGWKTKAFWGSILTVMASVALAITDIDIPGLPPGATKVASIISSVLTALGYTAIRYQAKLATQSPTPPAPPSPPAAA
jgi:hypothetical protein